MNTPITDLRICRSFLLMLLACCTIADYSVQAVVRQDDAASEEESVQIKTAERFLSVLEKNPRYGTALDRVYGHHVEFGSLDKFLSSLNERAQKQPGNGASWMMLGMFEAQRGGDAAAVEALTQADKLRAQDGLASFYLGQAQLRIGQSEEAIQSFERAISRKPPRADLLEIFQTLGRVHQRAQRTDEAMRVWQRLEELFPSDPRVLEQIAVTLAEEGQSALALPRYQKLAELERDDYRKVIFQVTAAGLTIKTGKKDDGIKQLENVLSNLNPESWLYRDVRRRIEDVFLRSGDQDSLVKYYQRWLEGHPEDVEGMTRLARFLASSARVPEAIQWMEKALKLAPSRSDLRKSFIDQLVEDQRITDALAQYEQLVKSQPGNPDFLRDWGKLALRNREISEDARKKQATEIWNRMLTTRPNDALTVSQVADLFRQNKMNDEAEKLYKKAVELAPGDPQYREYLGEFLHIQKRSDEALAVWQEIAAGNRRNAVNITRLAEIYNSFGFPDKAVVEVAEAVKLDPKDFGLLIRAADYHSKAGKYDEAIAYVESAKSIAANDDEQDAVIQQRIEVLQVSQRLEPVANELLAKLRGSEKADEKDWYLAARYLEASRRWPEANEAVNNAMKINPKSIPSMTLAAKIAETSGDMGRASEISRSLADVDRRSRGDHLMNVSRLESQLGRANEALKAAQELIVSAPGKTENYEFYAQTCFRLGRIDEGLENLRKAVRINPNEPHLLTALASALAEQLRTEEAIEVYWRAFEKADEVEDKVGVTTKLAQLYQQINQFDKLVARFERDRREEDKRRESTICLAQAWQTGGDFTSARQELESLLSEDTRDTNLLNQLAKLCQSASDLDAAIGYQRQLVAIAPGHETEFPLAGMLMSSGQVDEAREIFVRLTAREEDAVRQMKSLDSLISQGDFASAIEVIEPLLAQNREDWELLYREGLAWASLDKPDEAVNRFQRILALKAQLDSLGRSANEKLKQAQAKAKSDNLRGITSPVPQKQTPLEMLRMSSQVQRATGLISDNRYYGAGQSPPTWMPESFGLARMAALGWLIHFEEEAQRSPLVDSKGAASSVAEKAAESNEKPSVSIIDLVRERAAAEGASRDSIYDWLFVAQLKNDFPAIFQMARRMAKGGGKEEQNFFLTSLSMRSTDEKSLQISNNSGEPQTAKRPALDPDDIQLMLDCFNRLNQNKTDEDSTVAYGNIIYSGGQAYVQVGNTYYPLSSFTGGAHLATVIEELRFAGKSEDALKLLNDHLGKASKASELSHAMAILHKEKRNEELLQYFDRWQQVAIKTIAEAPVTAQQSRSPGRTQGQAGQQLQQVLPTIQVWMGELGAEEENAQLATILDKCLAVADEEAKYRAKVKALNPKSATRVTQSGVSQIAVYYGKNQTYSNLTFPPANEWLDYPSIVLLYQVHEVFKKNDVMSDLADQLRKRQDDLSNAGADDERLLRNSLCLASALWWADEKDEATQWMAKALSYGKKDLSLQFALAGMYQERNDFEDALNIVEAIAPSDQRILQQRELMALSLAERIGDTDRARSAAERLFGLRLDAQTQISLVDRMKRLGLNSLADAVMARAERSTSSNQSSSLASLMMLYQGQGKTEQAIQVAHILLRKTPSPVSITQRTGRNPLRYQNSDSSTRTRALQLLQQSGELKKIIEGLENQLTRSPGAILPLQQLIEYYEVAGQKDEVQKKIQQALEVRPDSPMLRLQLAKQLEKTGKTNEACDQYLELLKIQPNWVTEELYQVDRLFTQAKRKTELVKALGQINLKQVSQPYYLINTASRLLQEESSAPIGLAMLEKIFDAFPQYRNNMMQGFEGDAVWKAEGVYKFVKRAILPSEQDIQTNPWIGLNQVYSYSSDGNVDVMFHRILRGLRASDKLKDLSESIADLIEKHPGWYSGRAMLALIELNSDRKQEALERLKLLAGDEKIAKTMLPDTCWIIGQELDKFTETRDLAIELFERAVASGARGSQSQMQYSPIVKLIEHYSKSGQKEKARQLLLNKLSQASFDQYDQQYAAAQRVQNATWAAGKLQSMDMPIDALRLYRGLIDKQNDLAFANQWNGNQADYYEKMVRKGLNDSLTSISSKNSDQAIAELLRVDKKDSAKKDSGVNAIDLMVSFPDAQALQKDEIKSAFVDLLKNLSKESAMAGRVSAKLDELASQHPDDFSVLTCVALWKLGMKREDAVSAVKQLVLAASDRPLEQIPEGRRPNSRQRRQAAQLIPLWLVARECIGSKELNDEGLKLAEICKAAAKRQLGNKEQSVILYDWGNLLLKAGRKDEAEARWTELLELTVDRPAPKAVAPKTSLRLPSNNRGELQLSGISLFHALVPNASLTMLQQTAPKPPTSARSPSPRLPPPTSAKASPESDQANEKNSNRIPPLTISQFRTAMLVARAAAQNGMAELSRKAIRESLKGGFPIPDPESTPASDNPFGSTRVIRRSDQPTAVNSLDQEVVKSLKEIVALWSGAEYPSQDRYELLKALVLPDNRPQEIRLYVNAQDILAARIESLAETVVSTAEEAGRIEELKSAITSRLGHPGAKLSGTALLAIIDTQLETDSAATIAKLDEVTQLLKKGVPTSDQQIAYLVGLRAFQVPALKEAAFPILHHVFEFAQASQDRNMETAVSSPLAVMVIKHLTKTGDHSSAQKYFESVLVRRQSVYAAYSDDYGLYVQQTDLATMAQQAAELQLHKIAMNLLARAVDLEVANYGRPPDFAQTLASLVRSTRKLDPSERYESWYRWTMPGESRPQLREVHDVCAPNIVPKLILDGTGGRDQLQAGLIGNFSELVDAAHQAGKVDDLKNNLQPLVEDKNSENSTRAEILLALLLISQNDQAAVPIIERLQDSLVDRLKPRGNERGQNTRSAAADYLVFLASLRSEKFVGLFDETLPLFRSRLQTYSQSKLIGSINFDWANRVSSAGKPNALAPSNRWKHWASTKTTELRGGSLNWWSAFEDQVVHLGGPTESSLYFRYPLTGNFKVSIDCFGDSWANANVGFGGILSGDSIKSVSGHESLDRIRPTKRSSPAYNQLMIEVQDNNTRYLLNNSLVYEEAVARSSPWLFLNSQGSHLGAFRNVKISGDAIIPDSVSLIENDRMDGWNCSTFTESQPRHRLMKEKPQSENDAITYYQSQEPTVFNWSVKDGQLIGKSTETTRTEEQSWIYYQRPLLEDETFSYQFFYVPGNQVAHPTIGQIALVLDESGCKTHWIATPWDVSVNDIATDNLIAEEQSIRAKLSLKSNDWNDVQLKLKDGKIVLACNGTTVYERELEPGLGTRFGLFRNKVQSSQVRNLSLSGNWPRTLPDSVALMELEQSESPQLAQTVSRIINDWTIAPLASEVVKNSRAMTPEEAYGYLFNWVLPSATNSNIRLHFSQAPLSVAEQSASLSSDGRLTNLLCPAVELVRVASQLGKLGVLSQSIDKLKPDSATQQHLHKALKTILEIESSNNERVVEALKEKLIALEKPYTNATAASIRNADFLVAWVAAQHQPHWIAANKIARKLREHERNHNTASGVPLYRQRVHALVGDVERLARSQAVETVGKASSQWTNVPYLKPEYRTTGNRPSTWSVTSGVAETFPAETWGQLFFQSPLRGKFEVLARKTTHGYKELSVAYGMHSADPRYDSKAVRIAKLMHTAKDIDKELSIPNWGQQADYRIVVDGNKLTTFTNGVQIHEEVFERTPDPWLVLQSHDAGNFARISDLRIVGSPEIPTEIDLIGIAGLAAWRADNYGEWFRTETDADRSSNIPWRRVDDELRGQFVRNTSGALKESHLVYQRPMLEDGVIEFETWYTPNEFEVHPALGSNAYLITPGGVLLHQLTDGANEVNGLAVDNTTPIPNAATSVALNGNDWNKIRLSLQGNQVTIAVNGVDVATHAIEEPANLRQFGLFRYTKTQCRVRKLLYRGEWPKSLPEPKDQQLAITSPSRMSVDAAVILDVDFTKEPIEQLKANKVRMEGPADRMEVSPEGLKFHLHDSKSWNDHPKLGLHQPLEGDCEITVEYKNAQLAPPKTGWGVAFGLDVILGDAYQSRVQHNLTLDSNKQAQHTTQSFLNYPGSGKYVPLENLTTHPGTTSGKLRLVRTGGRIDCYVASEGSDEFNHLNTLTIGNAPIAEVHVRGNCSDEFAKVDITLTRMTIRQGNR